MPLFLFVIFTFLVIFAPWLLSKPAPQKSWECRPQPGYCDIDRDWYQTHDRKIEVCADKKNPPPWCEDK